MKKLKEVLNSLVELAATTTKQSKNDVKQQMIIWLKELSVDKVIHSKDFDTYVTKTIKFLSIPSYHISKDSDKWFVEDIVRAAYNHVIGDHRTVETWIKETNATYEHWEKSADIEKIAAGGMRPTGGL